MRTLLRRPFRILAFHQTIQQTQQYIRTRSFTHAPAPAPAPAPALESFYHRYLLEHHFPNGTAQRLSSGITDITTDTQHIEVKRWPCWKDAIGQLLVYNGDDPKKELRVYLFGPYSTERKQHAVLHFSRLNIRVFDMFYDRSTHSARIIEYHVSSHPCARSLSVHVQNP